MGTGLFCTLTCNFWNAHGNAIDYRDMGFVSTELALHVLSKPGMILILVLTLS